MPCSLFTISWSSLKFKSIELVMLFNHLILCFPLLFCLQSFPASGLFPVSSLYASGGQSIGALASASVLPMNIQDSFLLGLTSWISLQSKRLSRAFSSTTIQKHFFFSVLSLLSGLTLPSNISHDYWKNHSFDYWTFVGKVMSLLFNMLGRFVIAFLQNNIAIQIIN